MQQSSLRRLIYLLMLCTLASLSAPLELRVQASSELIPARKPVADFATPLTFPVGTGPTGIVVTDFNADGKLDLATANSGSDDISILLGNGSGIFNPTVGYAFRIGSRPSIAVGDFNSDGKPDLIAGGNFGILGNIALLLGKGNGTFEPARYFSDGPSPYTYGLAVGDFNGDGKLDLVTTASNNATTVNVLLGQGDGSFREPQRFFLAYSATSVTVADFNGDGFLDLVVAGFGRPVGILLGRGDGSFAEAMYFGPLYSGPVTVADFDGDGKLDLVVSDNGRLGILLGHGDGTFATPRSLAESSGNSPAIAGDFNGDGRIDVVIGMYCCGPPGFSNVAVLLGKGDGTFQPALHYRVNEAPGSLAAGDFNGDGQLDVVTANYSQNSVSVLLNQPGQTARVQGYVYFDENSDGMRQASEPGIPDVQVRWNEKPDVIATERNGFWSFDGVPLGTWTFSVILDNSRYPYPTSTKMITVTVSNAGSSCCHNFGYTNLTPSATPTVTASEIPSSTPPKTATPSPTPSATYTPARTLTNTRSPTPTLTGTATPTRPLTPTITPSPTLTRQILPRKRYLPLMVKHTPRLGVWSFTGDLNAARAGHTATLLPNGQVLVAGGNICCDRYHNAEPIASAELYDPATGRWTPTGGMSTVRGDHTATLLPNGLVLVAGGYNGPETDYSALASAELYDPATGYWTLTGRMQEVREGHTATLLPNGKVLVTGGAGGHRYYDSSPGRSAELYDPATSQWTRIGSMPTTRYGHSATLLSDGQVLIAGGWCADYQGLYQDVAEIFQSSTLQWRDTGSLPCLGIEHTATLLTNGQVLVTGGTNTRNAVLYNPATNAWSLTGNLNSPRAGHTATLLPNSLVLVTGGSDSSGPGNDAELYNPTTGEWTFAGSLNGDRFGHSATLLPNGEVLIVGGFDHVPSGLSALSSAELYDSGFVTKKRAP